MKSNSSINFSEPWIQKLKNEIEYQFTRSTGAGGQHINKTESAVIIRFDLLNSQAFSEYQIQLLKPRLANRLTSQGHLLIREERSRERLANQKKALEKLIYLIRDALKVTKKRIKTKPSYSSIQKRIDSKKIKSKKKNLRSKIKQD